MFKNKKLLILVLAAITGFSFFASPLSAGSRPTFRNAFLEAKVTSLNLKNSVIVIRIKNTLKSDIKLHLLSTKYDRAAVRVVSERGASCLVRANRVSGILIKRKVVTLGNIDRIDRKKDMSIVSAGSFIVVSMKLRRCYKYSRKNKGDSFDFSGDFFAIVNGKEIQFSMSMADIKPVR